MAAGSTLARKRVWLILVFAFIASIGIYGALVCLLQQQRPAPPSPAVLSTLRPVLYLLAIACLLASVGWMHGNTRNLPGGAFSPAAPPPLPAPERFQTITVIALALAEACAIMGLVLFFLGASAVEFARFALGTVIVDALSILPRGIRYWAAWERQSSLTS
ncbi:MAG TPA: hypothetical protein VFB38_07600 [Chthonomonadaceae bacterium]|nr:hypothetical protein [Chthonomonadaceae bacterium]